MSPQLEHIWSRLSAALATEVDEPTYRIWLAPLRPLELDGERLVLEGPEHSLRWLRERFGRLLTAVAERTLGPGASVELVAAGAAPAPPQAQVPAAFDDSLGNPKLTFEQFVIGDSNRLAHAAALTVAEMPAGAYNPLFICGPPGVGKTHLLSSIANLVTLHDPGMRVKLTTGEAFTNAFVAALSHGDTDSFKARFRGVDILLVDDVQFLQHKTRTEEEFFHTFNALYDGGRQLVLTSDRPPNDLQALEDRLRERFQSGLVADVGLPDHTTRMAILRKRVHHDGIALADEGPIELIADRVQSNVRALEGALIRIVAYSSLTGRSLSTELTAEVLAGLYPQPAHASSTRTIADVQAATCEHFGLTRSELLSAGRSARLAWPRQLAMYLARELTGESLPAIGREFGNRDHTTVMHACKRAGQRCAAEDDAREAVEKLRARLDSPAP
ncbi:MAG TPA: chromosomal replication initiator protein DnaA [Solirubrobacteraceae bacterium]|nr:chromosomal replication initiator protein DnaA [Solirubrobacteraceae bacterium]